ncbi:MAG TPA: class F sortase, partial [Dehalococcoidia bacterium]|nr:class F sortase [Dehalococcoidia bacterium]
ATASVSPNPTAPATAEPPPTDTPAPADSATPEPPPPPAPPPARLIIPKIGVDARVVPLGEDASGAMASPDNPRDVGWWDEGTAPGDAGSAVLDGHVDFANYGAAVFWNLRLLVPGDTVQVVSTEGQTLTFTVAEVSTFDAADNSNIAEIFQRDDQPRLNLITCAGTFNPRTHGYDKRMVVFTTLAAH